MRLRVMGASTLLRGITTLRHVDFKEAIEDATSADLIYMDPPYQGVSNGRDNRYAAGVSYQSFCEALDDMNAKGLSFIISYDGSCGNKQYGPPLPDRLLLTHIEINAGVSSQATLLGRMDETIESLYLSRSLVKKSAKKE